MDFSFTDEQQQLRRSVREFAESEIAPHVMEWDEASQFPSELIPKLAEMGLLGVIFPEEYGGAGLGYIEYATVIEELSRVDGSIGLIVAAHNSLCTNHIYKFGSRNSARSTSRRLHREETRLLVADRTASRFGRRGRAHHRDAQGRRLAYQRLENVYHQWPLCGHCVAMAVTDKPKGTKGISAFIVEKAIPVFGREKKKISSACARATLPK